MPSRRRRSHQPPVFPWCSAAAAVAVAVAAAAGDARAPSGSAAGRTVVLRPAPPAPVEASNADDHVRGRQSGAAPAARRAPEGSAAPRPEHAAVVTPASFSH